MRFEPTTKYMLVAETDEERAILEAFHQRQDEVRVKCSTSLFSDYEIVVYLPVKQRPEHITKASDAGTH